MDITVDDPGTEIETANPAEEPLTLDDPRAQKLFDMQALNGAIEQVRQMIASAQVNLVLAQQGLLDAPKGNHDLHPEKFRRAILRHHQTLDLLSGLLRQVRESEEGLPKPSELEVASAVPPADLTG